MRPDMAALRREFEDEKRRVRAAGDPESIERLAALERLTRDPDFWDQFRA